MKKLKIKPFKEAEYAVHKGRIIQPVLMDAAYRPDGWLDFLFWRLIYVKVSDNFNESMSQLEQKLNLQGIRIDTNPISNEQTEVKDSSKLNRSILNQWIPDVENVKVLDLSCSNIKMIDANLFDRLVGLKKLNLSNNQIKTLPAKVFNELERIEEVKFVTQSD